MIVQADSRNSLPNCLFFWSSFCRSRSACKWSARLFGFDDKFVHDTNFKARFSHDLRHQRLGAFRPNVFICCNASKKIWWCSGKTDAVTVHEQSENSGLDAFAFGLCIQAQIPVNFVEQLHCFLGVWVSPEQNFVNVLDQSMVRDRARCWICDGRFLNLAFLKKNIARSFSLKHTAVPQSSHPFFKLQGFHVIVVAARKVFEFGFPQNEHCPFLRLGVFALWSAPRFRFSH